MVFSPSLKASTNSLFAPADDEQQELRGSRSKEIAGSSERASLLLSPSSSPSEKLTNDVGSVSGVDAGAGSMMEVVDGAAGSGKSSRNGPGLAMVAGVRDASVSSPPVSMTAGEGAVVSSQGRDFVEEVGKLSEKKPWRDCLLSAVRATRPTLSPVFKYGEDHRLDMSSNHTHASLLITQQRPMGREQVREKIVENFRERMQLRRSLIELEDQNVQNSIEVTVFVPVSGSPDVWLMK